MMRVSRQTSPFQVTLVTALFDIGREGLHPKEARSIETYLDWMTLVLSLKVPLVVITSPDLAPQIRFRRTAGPLKLIEIPLSELKEGSLHQRVQELLDSQESRPRPERPERRLPLYNVVTFQKSRWLSETASENPFGTEAFLWIDAGYGHGRRFTKRYLRDWPRVPELLLDDRVHILQVHPVSELSERLRYHQHRSFLATGCFGGTEVALKSLREKYEKTLERTLAEGLMDDDQAVMGSVFLENPSLFCTPGPTYGNYFEMLRYLDGKRVLPRPKGLIKAYPRSFAGGLLLAGLLAWRYRRGR